MTQLTYSERGFTMQLAIPTIAVLCLAMPVAGCAETQQASPAAVEPTPAAAAAPETAPAQATQAEPPAAPEADPAPAAPEPSKTIEVPLQPKSGSKLSGTATLTETPEGVRVALKLENVTPGEHGAHVHEKGDCSAPDAASAGGHFNPRGHDHGLPEQPKRHLGDLGNITIGKDGKGSHEITIQGANLKAGDPNSFVGRAIIVHEKKDDGGQPVGNAGGRIGCGEIK